MGKPMIVYNTPNDQPISYPYFEHCGWVSTVDNVSCTIYQHNNILCRKNSSLFPASEEEFFM